MFVTLVIFSVHCELEHDGALAEGFSGEALAVLVLVGELGSFEERRLWIGDQNIGHSWSSILAWQNHGYGTLYLVG